MRCPPWHAKSSQRGFSRRLVAVLGLFLIGSGLGLGCRSSDQPTSLEATQDPPWFVDVTLDMGLTFVHDAGPPGRYFMPQIMGSGAALFDFNNDGRLDIYLIQNGGPHSRSTNRLFRQEAGGRLTDVSAGSVLDIAHYGMGVAIGDVNNDGCPDVLVTQLRGPRLFLNQGHGTFPENTQ